MLKGKNLKDKQKDLLQMSYVDFLEELGKVYVGDIDMVDVWEIKDVLKSLGFNTEYNNDYLVLVD